MNHRIIHTPQGHAAMFFVAVAGILWCALALYEGRGTTWALFVASFLLGCFGGHHGGQLIWLVLERHLHREEPQEDAPQITTHLEPREAWLVKADEMALAHELFGDPRDWEEAKRRCVSATLATITTDAAWERPHDRSDA